MVLGIWYLFGTAVMNFVQYLELKIPNGIFIPAATYFVKLPRIVNSFGISKAVVNTMPKAVTCFAKLPRITNSFGISKAWYLYLGILTGHIPQALKGCPHTTSQNTKLYCDVIKIRRRIYSFNQTFI